MALKWIFVVLIVFNVAMPVIAFMRIRERALASQLDAAPEGFGLPPQIALSSDLPPQVAEVVSQTVYNMQYPWSRIEPITIEPLTTGEDVCAYTDLASDTISLANSCITASLSQVFAHELGHITDKYFMDEGSRWEYCEIRQIENCAQWHANQGVESLANVQVDEWRQNPAEDFAEEFVSWALPGHYKNHSSFDANSEQVSQFFSRMMFENSVEY